MGRPKSNRLTLASKILKYLPATYGELLSHLKKEKPDSVRKTLYRLRQKGLVDLEDEVYSNPDEDLDFSALLR